MEIVIAIILFFILMSINPDFVAWLFQAAFVVAGFLLLGFVLLIVIGAAAG